MIDDILVLMAAKPFQPFSIHLTNGPTIHVPALDYIHVLRRVRRVFVEEDDQKTYHIVAPEQISNITLGDRPQRE